MESTRDGARIGAHGARPSSRTPSARQWPCGRLFSSRARNGAQAFLILSENEQGSQLAIHTNVELLNDRRHPTGLRKSLICAVTVF